MVLGAAMGVGRRGGGPEVGSVAGCGTAAPASTPLGLPQAQSTIAELDSADAGKHAAAAGCSRNSAALSPARRAVGDGTPGAAAAEFEADTALSILGGQ
jgi:hypothetical protein